MADVKQPPPLTAQEFERLSLCDALDRILNKGVVIHGEITLSVANIDLLYLGLRLVLTSVETKEQWHTQNKEQQYDL
ncbi:gas vesicle protein [Shewanella salipaludis]|uniref:Gas vesicle protein n=1 Tax=Shewanella salipaludis TaxID=2723052 RepID=A0A972FWB6_9GAMM|nr:gas vesicle protein [Shewanella salipaludis]NMH66454.1 gas vesicle protein [Shewanella salipaludis]